MKSIKNEKDAGDIKQSNKYLTMFAQTEKEIKELESKIPTIEKL